jgi:hypothetical protein
VNWHLQRGELLFLEEVLGAGGAREREDGVAREAPLHVALDQPGEPGCPVGERPMKSRVSARDRRSTFEEV